jgi:hypothetical protein
MGRFVNSETGVVVSVADDKDERFASPLWDAAPADEKAPAKRASSKSDSK